MLIKESIIEYGGGYDPLEIFVEISIETKLLNSSMFEFISESGSLGFSKPTLNSSTKSMNSFEWKADAHKFRSVTCCYQNCYI